MSMRNIGLKFSLALIWVAGLSACSGGGKPNIELIQDMMDSPAHKAQDQNVHGKTTMRVPPAGTLKMGTKRYPYGPGDMDKAEQELKNPIAGRFESDILDRGKDRYDIYCAVCHGSTGKGDGSVAEKMPLRPPSLVNDQSKGFKDGKYFHIMIHGKGVMGGYANQIHNDEDRWAVVNYIRNLQKMAN